MVVPSGQTAVSKGTLLPAEPLIANAIWALAGLHEEREFFEIRFRLTVCFGRFGLDVRSSPGILLDVMALDRLAFVAQSHHELNGFDPSIPNSS
ncbi:hypothetical protein H9L39_17984 [Fusarium oxysporum f. sp. albedinis]|nr:hypothetical protein H9L39_17984 [Fusarium oxysporum f. sp. albedinis]